MAKVELDIRAQIANLNKGLDKTQKGLKNLQGQSNRTSKTMQGNMNKTNTAVTKLTGALGAMFTIGAAVQFTRAIIDVRGEFEKFRAVLENTLGSAEEANKEFAKIQRFAAETPFSVRELTDSFVKLVNQGFKPTTKELRQLGDLAAAVGKEFLQLTEAIIDAQTGEFERLKEFGIRASKEGDRVTFTFKEQKTQVDFTSKAIQEYILSLGDLEGVAGAMAAISETLIGKTSNLRDKWEALLDTMGGRTTGVMSGVIELLGDLLFKINDMLDGPLDAQAGAAVQIDNFRKALGNLEKDLRAEVIVKEIQRLNGEIGKLRIAQQELSGDTEDQREDQAAFIKQLELQAEAYKALLLEVNKGTDDIDGLVEVEEEQIETLKSLQETLKGLKDDRLGLNIEDEAAIELSNKKIKALEDEIKLLTELGKVPDAKKVKIRGGDLDINEDEIFEIEKELNKGRVEDAEKTARDIELINQQRIDKQLAAAEYAIETEKLLNLGKVEAIMSGLDLIAAANKDNAQVQQAVAIAQAIINGAQGITKTGAELGYPAAIPFQIALGLQTLAQIATIRSQKFEKGGYDVLSGRRHAQGGVDIGIGEAEAGEGVAVFSRQATQKYGKFLPAFTKMVNDGKVNVDDPSNFNFFYDDSKQVSKLEDIKKLLGKPEIRYEGKYRIETRNGQRTKVRI